MTYKELFEAQLEYNREAIAAKMPDDFKTLDTEIIYMLLLRYLEDLEDRMDNDESLVNSWLDEYCDNQQPDGAEY